MISAVSTHISTNFLADHSSDTTPVIPEEHRVVLADCARSTTRKYVISGGSTGLVSRLANGNVLKHRYPDALGQKQSIRDIDLEFRIYEKLPRHDRILQCISYYPDSGLELEYLENGTLRAYLVKNPETSLSNRVQWARDAAEGLNVLHMHDVVHGDVNPNNLLLDADLRLKIIDFAGSSLDGSASTVIESIRFYRPRPLEEQPTRSTDLFALGSAMYEMMTGQQPYHDRTDEEVDKLFSRMEFPDVSSLVCSEAITRCWTGDVATAEEVVFIIDGVLKQLR